MSDWGWVTLAFAVVYGTLVTYTALLMRRAGRLGRIGGGR